MALQQDGALWAIGRNAAGQLGDGTNTDSKTFKKVLAGVKTVATGMRHTMAVKQDGTLWATGRNNNGQLGDGSVEYRNVFKQVLAGVETVAAGA